MTKRKLLMRPLLPLLASLAWACASPTQEVPPLGFDLSTAKLVDLTHTYDEQTLYWPTSPSAFELEPLAYGQTDGGYFYASNSLSTPEHGGTHLDAPIHFAADGWTTEQIPLGQLIGPAVVIDVTEQAARDADYQLARKDVKHWEAQYGAIPAGAIVLLRTGWSERWPDPMAYLGDDTPGDASNLHFPGFGEAATRYLVETKKVAVLGIDTASIDHGASTDFMVHRVATAANVPGLENVANLSALPPVGAWVIALPMKIGGGSGGPVRIVGLVPPE